MPTTRARSIRRVLLIEGTGNLVVAAAKLLVGLQTGSLALVSDALHSATDLANNVLAWFAMGVAEQPPDEDHPYGHAKFETLSIFVLGTLLSVLAVEILLGIVRRGGPQEVGTTPLAFGVVLASLATQLGLASWQMREARRLDSELLRADAAHTFSDSATTIATIVGWQLAAFGLAWLDSAVAVVVAGLVLVLAYRLFRRAVPILVDGASVHPDELRAAALDVSGVQEVGRVRSRWEGPRRVADITVRVDPNLDAVQAHAVADAVERRLQADLEIADAVVHVEPLR
ncbi:MAG: cation diffusion facilitator family transporter [Planctomycetota bacterium]